MKVEFDQNVKKNDSVMRIVKSFLSKVTTQEATNNSPIVIRQDGKSDTYYIKCDISAQSACPLLDLNAKLEKDQESFRANRELLTNHNTYKRMASDAEEGREFNDLIVEYNLTYSQETPLKVWGGQHRVKALQEAYNNVRKSRYHGFKIFFSLSKKQRTEIALISNTNISVSNDLFDRLQEETFIGLNLRLWCYKIGLLKEGEDFPDQGSTSEKINVRLARTFIVNYFKGKEKIETLKGNDLDKEIYVPYLCESGANVDPIYEEIVKSSNDLIWEDKTLLAAGKAFASLHKAQHESVKESSAIPNRKGFRNKAITESIISAWAYVAGLLQNNKGRLRNHYAIPKTSKKIPDPLNAQEMSTYSHDSDDPTYRGLGARSSVKERQRVAQLFLAKSMSPDNVIDKNLMNKAVSQVVGIISLQKGYT